MGGLTMTSIQEIFIPEFEKVLEIINPTVGLHAFVAIHNTILGPALGGLRIFPYAHRDEALVDVLRLAQGMTYKSAAAGLSLGGGKSVIMADPAAVDKKALLLTLADALNALKGQYIVAEDLGSTPEDMEILQTKTPHVVALCKDTSSGDPSRFTAWGVFRGIQAVAEMLWGTSNLHNKTIAIQGLGNVGAKLADYLFWHGAKLIIADINSEKTKSLAQLYKATSVDTKEILSTPCDILAPCALGGVFNDDTIPQLRCKGIAGGANNQLLHSKHGLELMHKGILYAPDFVINAGGLINASAELTPGGYDPLMVREKVDNIKSILHAVFVFSNLQQRPPHQIVEELAESRLKHKKT